VDSGAVFEGNSVMVDKGKVGDQNSRTDDPDREKKQATA